MNLTKFITARLILPFLLAFCVVTAGAAASSGTLVATDALQIEQGEEAPVLIFLNGSYELAPQALQFRVHYDESVAECTNITLNSDIFGKLIKPPTDKKSGFRFSLVPLASGEIPTETWLCNIIFKAKQKDGSGMQVGLELEEIGVNDTFKYIDVTTVQNGTFKTKDEVAPVIDLTTSTTVSSTFTIAGTIYDVGGVVGGQSKAQATLENETHPAAEYDLRPLGGKAPGYTFSKQVTWPVFEPITLTVEVTDAAGNRNLTEPLTLEVVDVGFSNPEPADGSYIKAIPEYVRVVKTAIQSGSVQMYLGSAGTAPTDLKPIIDNVYVRNTTPLDHLSDGRYWVNVSGTDIGDVERYLNWTFTLDTTAPVINSFTIADSDGDGYIEAGETLTLNWNVADLNFDSVALVDVATGEVLWSNKAAAGSDAIRIEDGNRDLAFRAYDKAGNYDSHAFHLYYNYMIWVNSTKMGEFSGIDTTYTALKDISRIDVSSISLYGCTVTLPTLSTLERNVTNVGQVTNDTYITVDNNANRTLTGSETYRKAWVLDPNVSLDFLVKVPYARNANLVLVEANETYIAELIKGGMGGMDSVNYTDLIRKTAYIFIEDGWAKIEVGDNGSIDVPKQSGKSITTAGNISETLHHPANQVNLHDGYRLSDQQILEAVKLPPGDYVLAAIAMDGDRLGFLAAMLVMAMESGERVSIPSSVVQGGNITVSFNSSCDHLGVVLLRDVAYNGTALVDAVTLGKDTLHLNLTYDDIPATQKLIGNIYVSPSSGKYVVANTNKTTISTSGLNAGDYRVYMIGLSAKGTMQAYEEGMLKITPGGSIHVTSAPSGATIYLDESDTGLVTNGTLTCVPAGSHNVKVTLAGYAPKSSQVQVDAGDTVSVHFDLVSLPVANFTANVTTGPVPLSVQFTDTSTGEPTSRSWNFGDGAISSEQNPVHTYTSIGRYNVTLTATNSAGSDALTRYRYISVQDVPPAPVRNETSSFHDNGTTVRIDDGQQQVTFNQTTSNGTVSGNDILLSTGILNVTIQTDGLTTDAGGNQTGNVTGVLLESNQPLMTSLDNLGNVSVAFNASMNGYNPDLMISTTISSHPSGQASSAFTLAATNAGLNVTATAYAVYFTKTNLGNDTISNATLQMTVSRDWVNAQGGPEMIRIFRQGDDGDVNILTPTWRADPSDNTMLIFEAFSPDGFSAFAIAATKSTVTPTPTPSRSTGGGTGPAYTTYTGTGTLKVNNAGTVLQSVKVNAEDTIGSLFVPISTTALDADGKPLTATTLTPLASGDLPAVPSGALFSFAGYVYEAGPAGATFDPAITLTFDIPEDIWNSLDTDNNDLVVKWYNEETGEWEDVPTTVYKGARSVDAKITHFSIFALFTEPVTTPTEPTTPTTPTEPPTTPPAEGDLPADGFPMTTVLAIFAILVIVIAAGYFFMVRK